MVSSWWEPPKDVHSLNNLLTRAMKSSDKDQSLLLVGTKIVKNDHAGRNTNKRGPVYISKSAT